jgi:hypothetical protein
MAQDVLNLGGVTFTAYSTPDVMGAGGKQIMIVHKLPGGSRVIDTLGPDENQISWRGHMFDDFAYARCLQLDAMRAAGAVLPLTWGGQFRSVIIADFAYRVRRLPVWVEYSIDCTVVTNPQLGNIAQQVSTSESLVQQDFTSADAVVGINAVGNINTAPFSSALGPDINPSSTLPFMSAG